VCKCCDEKKKRQDGGYQTINAESVDKSELKVQEAYRESRAYRGIEECTQAQTARERVICEERRQCEHVQIKNKAEIPQRHVEDAPIRTVGDGIASVDSLGAPQHVAIIDRIRIIKRVGYSDERKQEH